MPPAKRSAGKPRTASGPRTGTKARSKAEVIERRRARERRALKRRLIGSAVIVVVLAGVVFFSRADEDAVVIDEIESSGACTFDTAEGSPPISGSDDSTEPAAPNFYQPGADVLPDAAFVRALRQGFVVLWYDPAADPATLAALSDRFGRALLLAPRTDLDGPVVVTAWERRLRCESVDEAAIVRFVEAFTDQAPESGFV